MTEYRQIKVSVSEEYWLRIEDARTAGRLSNTSGLAKVAFGHAMQNGQAATEDLLRNGKPARPVGHELLEQILEHVATLERESADVKRCVVQCAAMLAGFLVLLAIGTALYLRPLRTA